MSIIPNKRKRASRGNGKAFPSLINDFFSDPFFTPSMERFPSPFTSGLNEMPSANLRETNNEYIVELSAPGLNKEDFNVDLQDGVLTISSEKEEEENKDEGKDYKRREFSYSSFARSFTLPENISEEKIEAKYNNGVLEVKIPKKEVTVNKPKKEIKVS
jgi:HSP20 family protein